MDEGDFKLLADLTDDDLKTVTQEQLARSFALLRGFYGRRLGRPEGTGTALPRQIHDFGPVRPNSADHEPNHRGIGTCGSSRRKMTVTHMEEQPMVNQQKSRRYHSPSRRRASAGAGIIHVALTNSELNARGVEGGAAPPRGGLLEKYASVVG